MDYSAVRIGEENILALRALLLEGPAAWTPIHEQVQEDDETAAGYMSLIVGAFHVAVLRKFSPTYTSSDIIQLVAEVRIALAESGGTLNALVAESLIREVLNAPQLKDDGGNDVEDVVLAHVFVLLFLVVEADYDRAGLEQFIEDATAQTEKWLAARRAGAVTQVAEG
ncbi:hypothetical protein GCM10022254_72100 [Actinomadura meridiana]|uniref:Uncharacterized protein n=1 Tax=Actinomadura meridiana TaxID=559626 RepID=A0ABP8CP99_9ACTN